MRDAEETARRLLRAAEADQNEASMTAIGALASTLYASLIAGDVPAALAATLTTAVVMLLVLMFVGVAASHLFPEGITRGVLAVDSAALCLGAGVVMAERRRK